MFVSWLSQNGHFQVEDAVLKLGSLFLISMIPDVSVLCFPQVTLFIDPLCTFPMERNIHFRKSTIVCNLTPLGFPSLEWLWSFLLLWLHE